MRAEVSRFPLPDPGDVSGLDRAITSGRIDPAQIVAIIGKTHGNGLVNDYTRAFLTQSLSHLIGAALGQGPHQVRERIPFVFSGGVEGVLSPHYTVLTVADDAPVLGRSALAIGVAFSPELRPSDIGRQRQIDLTADAVRRAMQSAGIANASDVHLVQVKGPAFGVADIRACEGAGAPARSSEPGRLMGFGRAASALGVGRALDEIPAEAAVEAAVLTDFGTYSTVASCSAGVEVQANEVIVLGMSAAWSGPLAIAHAAMTDALDVQGVHRALGGLGLSANPQLPPDQVGRLRAGFVKCEASRDGLIRGRPHTMLNDGDIDQQRHIRGAVGALVAGVLGDTALFVSGGAEHQGPPGGGLVALIAERPNEGAAHG